MLELTGFQLFLCLPYPGTIGLLGSKSPPFFTHGRMMKSLVNHLQDTPFYVDQRHRKVFIDFGNSLPINENGTMDTGLYDGLLVALPLNKNPSLTCSDNLLWLGMVYSKYPNWYQNSAGVQIFPALGSLSDDEMGKLSSHPLVVVEVHAWSAIWWSWYSRYVSSFTKLAWVANMNFSSTISQINFQEKYFRTKCSAMLSETSSCKINDKS